MKPWKLLAAAAALTPSLCLADSPWSGDASAGYIRTTGNTNSTALNFKGALDWKSWKTRTGMRR